MKAEKDNPVKDIVVSEVAKKFNFDPIPGRFFFREIPEENLRIKDYNLYLPKDKAVNYDMLEQKFIDHPSQGIIVAVGKDIDHGAQYREKMFVKTGDVIIFRNIEAVPIMFEGVRFFEGTQSIILTVKENTKDYSMLDEKKQEMPKEKERDKIRKINEN